MDGWMDGRKKVVVVSRRPRTKRQKGAKRRRASRWRPRLDVVLMHFSCCSVGLSAKDDGSISRIRALYISCRKTRGGRVKSWCRVDFIATAENSPWLIFREVVVNKENDDWESCVQSCTSHRTFIPMRKLSWKNQQWGSCCASDSSDQLLCRYTFERVTGVQRWRSLRSGHPEGWSLPSSLDTYMI